MQDWHWDMKRIKYYLGFMIACLIMIAVEIVLINDTDFSVDEVYSYGLANHLFDTTIEMQPRDGYVYANGVEPFAEYMAVQPGNQFNYANVWKNQTEDVHPPLYYAILHTICSLLPGSISKWYAGMINIIFLLLTMLVAVKIVYYVTKDENASLIFLYLFATSSWILNTATFLRMYVMAMFFCTWYTYWFMKHISEQRNVRFYVVTFISAIAGALTHYYVIVYLVLICILYGLILLYRREYKSAIQFAITMAGAGSFTLLIFPAIIRHLFVSDRGKQSIGNMTGSLTAYVERIKEYIGVVYTSCYENGLKHLFFLLSVVFLILLCMNRKRKSKRYEVMPLLLLIVPGVVYFLIVAKIAVYVANRYVNPIYACSIIVMYLGIYYIFASIFEKKILTYAMLILLGVIINMGNAKAIMFPYFESIERREEKYTNYIVGADCLYIYNPYELWKIQDAYLNISKCNETLFIQDSEFAILMNSELMNTEKLIVYIDNSLDKDFLIESLRTVLPQLTNQTEIENGYATVYCLSE